MHLASFRRTIAIRQIDDRRRRFSEGLADRVPDDACDDVRVPARADPSANRLGTADESPHELLVHDGLPRRRRIGEVREIGYRAKRYPHRLEVAGRDEMVEVAIGWGFCYRAALEG